MKTNTLTVTYPEELLRAWNQSAESFEAEARLLLAVKLYELDRVSTGMGAQLAGMDRVSFMLALSRFGLSPVGIEPGELAEDVDNA